MLVFSFVKQYYELIKVNITNKETRDSHSRKKEKKY